MLRLTYGLSGDTADLMEVKLQVEGGILWVETSIEPDGYLTLDWAEYEEGPDVMSSRTTTRGFT